jgi:hypothetical protein
LGLVAVVAFGAGCTVHARGTVAEEPVGTTYVTSAPVEDYSGYPSTTYEGHTVFYVHGQWGYPNEGRWVAYRNEPPNLVRYRTRVKEAPPAHPREEYRDREYRGGEYRAPGEAPPAVPVR